MYSYPLDCIFASTRHSVGTAMKIGELQGIAMPSVDPVALMAVPLFHITALCPVGLM